MAKITQSTLDFLNELKENNSREWFNANKNLFEKAKKEIEDFVDALIPMIARVDPSIGHHTAKECVFRIYRDVRFSNDKSPYKTHFGAYISAATSKSDIHSYAGYYFHIEPSGESMLAGGAYMPQGPWLKGIRKEISYNSEEFKRILNNKSFRQIFGELEGEKLKKTPRDYPADHPEIELLKLKSFLAVHKCTDNEVVSPDFLEHSVEVFKTLYPLNHFLNEAKD
jgi:uncharacterized protein (TIGR02453 family)